jgi:tetratricopeptide (TPR) repeat protein
MQQSHNKLYILVIYAVLALATIIAFEPVRNNAFVTYDDDSYVTKNPQVQAGLTWSSIIWAFTEFHAANWHPLTWLSHMLDCELFGPNPFGHHLTNLLFHLANTLLLFWVLKRMTGALWQSAFVAAAFALHPLHVESVAWVAERKDVLSGFFWMLTIAAYIRYTERPCIGRYLLVVLAFCLGLMAKPMAVTLPFVLLLLDYWPLGRFQFAGSEQGPSARRLFGEKIPLLLLAAVSSVVTFIVQKTTGTVAAIEILPVNFRVANAVISYIRYIGKMIYPVRLAALYPFAKISMWQVAASALLLLAVSRWVILLARSHRFLLVGWLWYLGTLVPVIGLVQVGNQAIADRYTYIPLIGIFIMVAWGLPHLLAKWRYRRIALSAASVLVFAVLLLCTRRQVKIWQNDFTLFGHAIAVTENNPIMHNNFALAIQLQGRIDEAISHYRQILQTNPKFVPAHNNLALALQSQGKFDEAIGHYRQVLQFAPHSVHAHNNLGLALQSEGRLDEAISHYLRALELRPKHPNAHRNLALAYVQQGKIDQAVMHFSEALRARPNWPEVYDDLARLKAVHDNPAFRDPEKAIQLAKRACELTGYKSPEILDTLAVTYAAAGRFSRALETAEKALKLAEAADKKELAGQIQARLQLYKAGQPCIEK